MHRYPALQEVLVLMNVHMRYYSILCPSVSIHARRLLHAFPSLHVYISTRRKQHGLFIAAESTSYLNSFKHHNTYVHLDISCAIVSVLNYNYWCNLINCSMAMELTQLTMLKCTIPVSNNCECWVALLIRAWK